jgi:hypothetical protein
MRRRRDRGFWRQPTFRKAAARPIKTDPMINNFAASGTGSDHNGAAPAPVDGETTMADATAVDADVAGAAGRVVRHPVVDSSESAKPTGTTSAATSAASNTTRNRFRRVTRMFASPPPGIVRVRAPVRSSVRSRPMKLQVMCHERVAMR